MTPRCRQRVTSLSNDSLASDCPNKHWAAAEQLWNVTTSKNNFASFIVRMEKESQHEEYLHAII